MVFGKRHEHADAPHPFGLLRARCEWPGHRPTAEQRDEIAASHVEHAASLPAILWPGS
jgi:hypothetical protein